MKYEITKYSLMIKKKLDKWSRVTYDLLSPFFGSHIIFYTAITTNKFAANPLPIYYIDRLRSKKKNL